MKKTVRDIDVKGRKVIERCDFNVPMADGKITDDTRITSSLPTINYLLDQGAAVILMSHMGRPKGKADMNYTLKPVADRLSALLGRQVMFISSPDVVDDRVKAAAAALKPGQVMLLENVRFRKEETDNDPGFAKELASMADIYVNDASYVSIRLIEYGSNIVKNPYSDGRDYDVAMMDTFGERYYFNGTMYSGYDQIFFTEEDSDTIIDALCENGTVRFAITETDNATTKYNFTIEDTTGFFNILPYNEIGAFSEGLAKVGKKGKYGYIDTNGDLVIQRPEDKANYDGSGHVAFMHLFDNKIAILLNPKTVLFHQNVV